MKHKNFKVKFIISIYDDILALFSLLKNNDPAGNKNRLETMNLDKMIVNAIINSKNISQACKILYPIYEKE